MTSRKSRLCDRPAASPPYGDRPAVAGDPDDPRAILRARAHGTGLVRRRQAKTLSLLPGNRNAHPGIAAAADLVAGYIRKRFALITGQLTGIGGLPPELTQPQAEQILWFYFGFEAWRTVRDMGRSWKYAAEWLAAQASALSGPQRSSHLLWLLAVNAAGPRCHDDCGPARLPAFRWALCALWAAVICALHFTRQFAIRTDGAPPSANLEFLPRTRAPLT
jgi:hypothetical protein